MSSSSATTTASSKYVDVINDLLNVDEDTDLKDVAALLVSINHLGNILQPLQQQQQQQQRQQQQQQHQQQQQKQQQQHPLESHFGYDSFSSSEPDSNPVAFRRRHLTRPLPHFPYHHPDQPRLRRPMQQVAYRRRPVQIPKKRKRNFFGK